jgi:nucleoid DNA-binding protein
MKDKMTFAQLKDRIADVSGFSRRRVHALVKETVAVVKEGLLQDGYVSIAGIGRFTLKERPARSGRNPRTGEPVDIPAQNTVVFKPDAGVRRFIDRAAADRPVAEAERPGIFPDSEQRDPAPPLRPESAPAPASESEWAPTSEPEAGKRRHTAGILVGGLMFLLLAIGGMRVLTNRTPESTNPIGSAAGDLIARTAPISRTVSLAVAPDRVAKPEPSPATGPASTEHPPPATDSAAEPKPPPVVRPEAQKPLRYAIITGDSLWTLADRYYNAPYLWPNIYRVNRHAVRHPDILEVGQAIAVPPLEGSPGELTPADIWNTATGYFFVYDAYRRAQDPRAPFYLWVAYRLDGDRLREAPPAEVDPGDLQFVDEIQGKDLIRQAVAIGFQRLLTRRDTPGG